MNKRIANIKKLPLVGCASHRFNLAVQEHLKEHEVLVEKIKKLASKLKHGLPAAKLRRHTPLASVTRNQTRWSSTFEMLKRYTQIREYIRLIGDADIDDLCLTPRENRDVDTLLPVLTDLDAVTKVLQAESTTVMKARDMQDETVAEFPQLHDRLSSTANIVHSPTFESAVVRIQAGEDASMSSAEKRAVQKLRSVHLVDEPDETSERLSICQRAEKRRKLNPVGPSTRYIDTSFITPTSNVCERFFSKVGHSIGPLRRRLHTENIEAQMFLHCNMDLWGPTDVNSVI